MKTRATLRYAITLPVRITLAFIYLIAYILGATAKKTEKLLENIGKKITKWTNK